MFVLYSLIMCNALSNKTWVLGAHKSYLKVMLVSQVLASWQLVVGILVYIFVTLLWFVISDLLTLRICIFTYLFFYFSFFLFFFLFQCNFFIFSFFFVVFPICRRKFLAMELVFSTRICLLEFVVLDWSTGIYLGNKCLLYNV